TEEITIVHAGNIFDYQNPKEFWKELKRKIDSGEKIKIKFIGTVGPAIKQTINKIGLSEFTEYLGFLSYKEMLKHLSQASYLLVCATERRHVPGKLFEYLRIGKPIIAFGDDNEEVKGIIEEASAGKLYKYSDSAKDIFEIGNSFIFDKSKIEIYERKNIAKDLIEVLNQ
ncbi:MAG: glycosyltransferase, partial [Bacteroidetes bacterium]|nr:glycosyltransferase [Bacteroidota bacterium]